jgi:hypothetical protein
MPLSVGEDEPVRLDKGVSPEQFQIFQLNTDPTGPTILDSTAVDPLLAGDKNPDVLMHVELSSFHLGDDVSLDPNTRATLRMNIGKDESSTDKRFEAVFWSIAAGLNLYDQQKKMRPESKDLNADFSKALANRPIEIPGGLARITFDIVKHQEPPWWKRIFAFAQSDTGTALVSALGFPAITTQAIRLIDKLITAFDGAPEVLFKGAPLRLALTKQARLDFTGGNTRVRLGAVNRGFCVFVRGKDFNTVAKSNALYYPTIRKLVPADVAPGNVNSGDYKDPLANVTYAIFRLGTRETRLDPTFSYGA